MTSEEQVALVQRILGQGSGEGATALLAEHPDPTVRLVAELLARSTRESEPEPAPAADQAPNDEAPPPSPPEAMLRRRLRALSREIERLWILNDTLAAALGACELCWGDDPQCSVCRGRGGPGARHPDRELFSRLVVPAVRRLKEAQKSRGLNAVGSEGQPPHASPMENIAADTERSRA